MSLLGSLLGGGQGDAGGASSLVSVAGQLIQQAGGVQGLASTLQQHGLGETVQSWIGSGANQAISGDQLNQVLQKTGLDSVVNDAAGKLGVDPSQLVGQLAQVLPHAVDHLTPDGQAPSGGGGFDLSMLGGLAERLLAARSA
ncbi:MAG TPA: YidB family protein [Dyella sp.]|uniref:YidB family protein n=1 Tax=Dyella sp. TaxID=1869338 RepID=UPI002BEE0DDE|nr:YidB family protein [Dyella sp.]HTV86695.1 YidB family protein [Dyella sp.]